MNTTSKFIYDTPEFDMLDFEGYGYNRLFTILSYNDGVQQLVEEIRLNDFGKVESRKKQRSSWVSYPPLNSPGRADVVQDLMDIEELYFYNDKGRIVRMESYHLEDGTESGRSHYDYRNGKLSGIRSVTFSKNGELTNETFYKRNTAGLITQITGLIRIDDNLKSSIETKYSLDSNHRVVKKAFLNNSTIGGREIESSAIFEYSYNSDDQLDGFTSRQFKPDGRKYSSMQLVYIDSKSDCISKCTVYEEGTEKRSIHYQYKEAGELGRKEIVFPNGDKTTLLYNRR